MNKRLQTVSVVSILVAALLVMIGLLANSVRTQGRVTNAVGAGSPEGVITGDIGSIYFRTNGTSSTALYVKTSGTGNTGWEAISQISSPGVPAGAILMVNSGSCPAGYTEQSAMNGRMPFGTLNANADVGGTGGNDNIVPAGINSAPTFVGNAFTSIINHTHPVTDPGHVHTETNNSATTGSAVGWGAQDTSTGVQSATGYSTLTATTGVTTNNPAGGVSSITPTGTNSAPIFTGTSFDNRSAFVKVIFCKKN